MTRSLVVAKDPRLPASITDAGLVRQYELARDIQADRVRVAVALGQAASLRKQLGAVRDKAQAEAGPLLDELAKAIDRAAGPAPSESGSEYFDAEGVEPTALRRLAQSLSELQSAVESADAAPTEDAVTGLAERRKLVELGLARWEELLAIDLPKAGKALEAAGLPGLSVGGS